MQHKLRKTVMAAIVLGGLVAGVAGCGSSGQAGGNTAAGNGTAAGQTNITVWDIQTGDLQKVIQSMVDDFNQSHPNIHATVQFFENDPYKQKLQVAMGAHNPPDIFFGWGGGILKSYIDAGDVVDLTDALNSDPQWKNRYLPSVMNAVTFNSHIYGVPNNYVQPVFFFYNKKIFDQYGLQPPKTWDDLLHCIQVLKQHNVIPIALAGKDKWPDLMYEEYLVDRIGGPQVFDNIVAGKPNAWSDPAVVQANQMIQQLVDMGAFEPGYAGVSYGDGSATALVYTNKAAMQLMGSWDFSSVLTNAKSMIDNGELGWFPFPSVPGGKGDPNDVAGNPSNFYSISGDSKNKDAALTFLKDAVLSDNTVKRLIDLGQVPPVQGIESQLQQAKYGDYMTFQYNMVKNAPHFQLSWDQALPPTEAQQLLTDLDKVFLKQMTPQQFSADMNKYLQKQ